MDPFKECSTPPEQALAASWEVFAPDWIHMFDAAVCPRVTAPS